MFQAYTHIGYEFFIAARSVRISGSSKKLVNKF